MPKTFPKILFITAALIAVYFLFFYRLDALGLTGPDEPRYAEVAREMIQSHDYVTPRLLGQPWFEKPALYYWAAALGYFLLGINETAARLPSAFAALLMAGGLWWGLKGILTDRARHYAFIILSTCLGVVAFSHAASTDMLLTSTFSVAMIFIFALLAGTDSHREKLRVSLAYFALGLSALAKGPVGILLAALILLFFLWASGRWMEMSRLRIAAGTAIIIVVAAPWYLWCFHDNGWNFIRTFILQHNLERFATNEFQHAQPFWFYIPVLFGGFLPWTFYLLLPLVRVKGVFTRDYWRDHVQTTFLCSWILVPLLFFTTAQSKLPGYILPVLVPLAIILGKSLDNYYSSRETIEGKNTSMDPLRWSIAFEILFCVLLALFRNRIAVAARLTPSGLSQWIGLGAGFMIVVLLICFWRSRDRWFLVFGNAGLIVILVAMVSRDLLPGLNGDFSTRPAAHSIEQIVPRPAVYTVLVSRDVRFGLDFYLNPRPVHLDSIQAFEEKRDPHLILVLPATVNISALGVDARQVTLLLKGDKIRVLRIKR